MKFWRNLSYSTVDHALAGVSPSVTAANCLERAHNRLNALIVKIRRQPGELSSVFAKRKNKELNVLKHEVGIDIRSRLAYKLATWCEHLYRHKEAPPYLLLHEQDDLWLQAKRAEQGSRSIFGGATGTRSEAGFPQRWAEGWVLFVEERLGWDNLQKSKSASRERSELIRNFFLVERTSQRLALADA